MVQHNTMNDFLASTPIFSSANVPTENQLLKVVSCVGQNWMFLGVELGLSYDHLRNLRVQLDSEHERIFDMLMTWKRKNGVNATFQRLIQCMSNCRLVDIDWFSLKEKLSD